jgi:hypothetical protein
MPKEHDMTNENTSQSRQGQQDDKAPQPQQPQQQSQQQSQQQDQNKQSTVDNFDALANKKPEDLTPEELRLMADTMPGEGPGD